MPKINLEIKEGNFRLTASSSPELKSTKKPFVREIPVSQSRREACQAIRDNLMAKIDAGIQADKVKITEISGRAQSVALRRIDNAVKAHKTITPKEFSELHKVGKPFRDFKRKLERRAAKANRSV